MKKNYEIVGKKIIAKVGSLTEKQLAVIRNYLALGYELEEYKPEADLYKKENIIAYLKKYYNEEAVKAFEDKAKELNQKGKTYAKDVILKDEKGKDVKDENDKAVIKHKKGDLKPIGYVGAIKWFKDNYKDYPEAPKTKTETDNK